MDHVISDQGFTGKAPYQMDSDELFAFVRHHPGSCLCVWCCDWDGVQYEQGIR